MTLRSRSPRFRFLARQAVGLSLLVSMLATTGCFGVFPLTKSMYRFNKEASSNEFVQSVLFWVFMILPAYELSAIADMLVLNVIEFWDEAPIKLDEGGGSPPPNAPPQVSSVTPRVSPSGDRIDLDFKLADGRGGALELRRSGPTSFDVVSPASGRVLGRIERGEGGDLMVFTRDGRLARRLPALATRG